MAYFRCSLGGGGNGAVITVTYGADFYNQTFVATNNVDTVSVVATSSGTVDIDVPSEGSWVVSCTIGADTYTSDPVLVDLSYATELISIPNGSTVTPTDDIQTWLFCAGIKDKAYTTLGEVLADEDTYINLLADSNACDYMARSTTWASTIVADADAMRLLGMYDYACYVLLSDATWASAIAGSTYWLSVLTDSVPTMTSNTAPSGECFAISEASGAPAYYAFNGNSSNRWVTNESGVSPVTNVYIGYTFTSAKIVSRFYVKFAAEVTACTYKLQGSNDGTSWTDIGSTNTSLDGYTVVENSTAYTSYRLFIVTQTLTSSSYNGGRVVILQFYGRAEAQTDIIVSAPSDTIYYLDNGSPVTLCTTDANGIGSVDWSDLPTGDITLYSSVAKNLSDLTADYSKTVKVTKNKVEAWLMPDKVLYWYGWESADLEDCSSANGWSRSSYSQTLPTHTTNYIDCEVNGTNKFSMVGTKNTLPNGTVLTAVCQGIKAPTNEAGFIANYPSKNMGTNSGYVSISSLSLGITTYTMTAQGYVAFGNNVGSVSYNREIKLYAFMYE